MKSQDADLLLARAQVGLAFLFAVGFIAILILLMFRAVDMSPTTTTVLTGLLSVFGTILTLVFNFFYARQRQAALPDPTTTTTTSTTTTTPVPVIVPAGATLVHAPSAPTAIVTAPLDQGKSP